MHRPADNHRAHRPIAGERGKRPRRLADRRAAVLFLSAVVILAIACPAASAENPRLIVAGGQNNLWLVRSASPEAFDVAVRPLGRPWKVVGTDLRGTALAAAAADDYLHVILTAPPAHLVFRPDSEAPMSAVQARDADWPPDARVAAAFEMADPNRPGARDLVAIIVAPRKAYHVFRLTEGEWRHETDYPSPAAGIVRAHATGAGGKIYLFLDDDGLGGQLLRWEGPEEGWARLGPLPQSSSPAAIASLSASAPSAATATALAEAETPGAPALRAATFQTATSQGAASAPAGISGVFAMATIDDKPALLRLADSPPTRGRVQMIVYDAQSRRFVVQDVRLPGGADAWRGADFRTEPPRAARLGGQIALLWKQGDRLVMGAVDRDGELSPPEEIDVFQTQASTGLGANFRDYFIIGALVVSAALAVYLRRRLPLRPIRLPPGVRPAPPLRRLLAGMIDLAPMFVLAAAIFPPPPMTLQQAYEAAKQDAFPDRAYYGVLAALALHIIYCVFMEHRFGMTIGKALLRMRVTGDQAQRATLAQLAQRNVMKVVELLWDLGGMPVLLIWPLISPSRQRLGDLFARTLVVTGTPIPQGVNDRA
jgi:uncharacterized RDD family membrane protein YckC